MRRTTLALATLALAACTTDSAIVGPQRESAPVAMNLGEESGTYLVRFGDEIPADFSERVSALGGEVVFTHAGAKVGAVSGLSQEGADVLSATSGLQMAADAIVELDAEMGDVESAAVDASETSSSSQPNTAYFYARQWGMRAISAPAAWAAGKLGSASTRVGILDTGLDYLHPDLYGRVDLAASRSFLSASENARVQASFPGAHPVADLHYHGTHVGATVVSNGLAAAGVTSKVTLVGMKVCAPGSPVAVPGRPAWSASCPTSGTLQAILAAADMGLPIINMSLGGSFLKRDYSARGGFGPAFVAVINGVFNYAADKGTLVVVSAGNSAIDMQHDGNSYKSYCDAPRVMCVSATGPASAPSHGNYINVDAMAPYTNYGGNTDVAAPGGSGRSATSANPVPNTGWVYAACSGFSLPIPGCRSRFYNPTTGAWSASVIGINGTSMASPHAAGVAALAASVVGNNGTAIRNRVMATSDDLGKRGKDAYYGAGRVNAAAAAGL